MSTSYKNMVSATHDTFLMSVLVTASPLWLTPSSSPDAQVIGIDLAAPYIRYHYCIKLDAEPDSL